MSRRHHRGQGLLEVLLALLVLALATLALLRALRPGLREPQATLLQLRAQEALASLHERLAVGPQPPEAAAAAQEAQWVAWQATLAQHWPQARAGRELAADGSGWHITLHWPAPTAGRSAERAWLALPAAPGTVP